MPRDKSRSLMSVVRVVTCLRTIRGSFLGWELQEELNRSKCAGPAGECRRSQVRLLIVTCKSRKSLNKRSWEGRFTPPSRCSICFREPLAKLSFSPCFSSGLSCANHLEPFQRFARLRLNRIYQCLKTLFSECGDPFRLL